MDAGQRARKRESLLLLRARASSSSTSSTRTSAAWTPSRAASRSRPRSRRTASVERFVKARYASYDTGVGKTIEAGAATFKDLAAYMLKKGEAAPNPLGRVDMLEKLLNEYI